MISFFFVARGNPKTTLTILRSFLDLCIFFFFNSFQDLEGSLVEVYNVVSQFRTFK